MKKVLDDLHENDLLPTEMVADTAYGAASGARKGVCVSIATAQGSWLEYPKGSKLK